MTKPADVTAALELARFDLEQQETHMGSAYMSPQPGYGDWVKYEDAAALAAAHADATQRAEAAEARVAELTAKLRKLATAQCFGSGEVLGKDLSKNPMGREILARMEFARAAMIGGE